MLLELLFTMLFCVYYREDGRDSMKFYTDPDYFLELWCLEIAKDTENQMKRHKQRGRRTAVSMMVGHVCDSHFNHFGYNMPLWP